MVKLLVQILSDFFSPFGRVMKEIVEIIIVKFEFTRQINANTTSSVATFHRFLVQQPHHQTGVHSIYFNATIQLCLCNADQLAIQSFIYSDRLRNIYRNTTSLSYLSIQYLNSVTVVLQHGAH